MVRRAVFSLYLLFDLTQSAVQSHNKSSNCRIFADHTSETSPGLILFRTFGITVELRHKHYSNWLLGEQQMAEDSIDSGLSSEISQHSADQAVASSADQPLVRTTYYERNPVIQRAIVPNSHNSSQIEHKLSTPSYHDKYPHNMSNFSEEYGESRNAPSDPRYPNPRMVHFVENTNSELAGQLARELMLSRFVGSRSHATKPPLVRNYSNKDYAYLPPIVNTQLDRHITIPSISSAGNPRLRERSLSEEYDYYRNLGEITEPRYYSSRGAVHDQSNFPQLFSGQRRASHVCTTSAAVQPDFVERVLASTGLSDRGFTQTRWSDSEMAITGGRHPRQQLQEQRMRQAQKQAAVAAAAAAAAVAIASIQTASGSMASRFGTHSFSNLEKTAQYKELPMKYRSCYSCGDEDSLNIASFRQGIRQDISRCSTSTQNPSIQCAPKQIITSQPSCVPPSGLTRDEYANYQSLEAILGRLNTQPPGPAPTFPLENIGVHRARDITPVKSNITKDESTSVYSMVSTSTLQSLPTKSTFTQGAYTAESAESVLPVRLPDTPSESKIEDQFCDYFPMASERYSSNPHISNPGSSSNYDWTGSSNPDQTTLKNPANSNLVNGLLAVYLVAGNGLSSSQVPLRDLYCVIEIDSTRKARSMIRTSTVFFEWKEMFELDLEENRFLAFLLYQWDPRTKHRLCFYGGIDLRNLVNRISSLAANCVQPRPKHLLSPGLDLLPTYFDKIALQLEPRGVLYLEFSYYSLERIFHRYQPAVSTSLQHASISDDLLFGVPIEELMERERLINRLLFSKFTPQSVPGNVYLPLFIRKCVEEIEHRGIEIAGIYRLAGSVWMKLQLRELFNRVTKNTLRALYQGDRQGLDRIIKSVDLSPERVPDIHAITALLKDFLRELPEPLFTSALYPMFYDAMQVTMPEFSQRGNKLMLNILDCLPIGNQEILLYLLGHFKQVTKLKDVNRMDAHSLSICMAPALFYPAPNFARTLDQTILEPSKMADIFRFILDIWPSDRYGRLTHESTGWQDHPHYGKILYSGEPRHSRPHSSEYQLQEAERSQQAYHRGATSTRSTLSGPPAPGSRFREGSPSDQRLSRFSGRAITGRQPLQGGRRGRVKFSSLSGPVERISDTAEQTAVDPSTSFPHSGSRLSHPPHHASFYQRKANSQLEIPIPREGDYDAAQRFAFGQRHRLHDIQASGSTGTDSGTRSSISASGSVLEPTDQRRNTPFSRENVRRSSRERSDYVQRSNLQARR